MPNCELPIAASATPKLAGVRRRALYLKSQGAAVFAWLHQPEHPSRHGILICPPIGHDQVHAHRALRHLADRCAAAGLSAVRFDYVNTGDSQDIDQANAPEIWLGNIRDLLHWMRDELGCEPITLMGLRLGASLAMQAAAEQPVESLVLWEPVVRGRHYARELKALSMMGDAPPSQSDAGTSIEVAGFVFAKSFLEHITCIDLLTVQPQCRRAVILSRDDLPMDGKLRDHLANLGIEAEQALLGGYADMMAEPHFTKVPQQAISDTVAAILHGAETGPEHAREQSVTDALGFDRWQVAGAFSERVVSISRTPDLFGILSEPASVSDLPVIVLPNAGSAYRVGPGRLYVQMARRLAACGFPCLRFDLAGLGDSVTPDLERENDCYPATAFRDIDLTIQRLQTDFSSRRVIVLGLCSGAYVAFQSAAQIASSAFVEAILVNPLTFYWKEGMTLESDKARQYLDFQYYKESAFQPKKWLKLLRGETKIGFLGAAKMLAQRLGLFRQKNAAPETPAPNDACRTLGHPPTEDLDGDLDRVAASGRHLTCFFSRSDPGYNLLMYLAGRKATHLCKSAKMNIHFVENADHTFSRRAARTSFIDALIAHLQSRYSR